MTVADDLRAARIVTVARAIAEQGFGRPWDDFLPLNAFDTDQADLRDYAIAAMSALAAQQGPEIKGLEWDDLTSPREDGPPEPTGDVAAETMIGYYSVCFDPDEDVVAAPWCAWSANECIGHFVTMIEAKAAAQADYETRIRSAVVAEPTRATLPDGASTTFPIINSRRTPSPHRGEPDVLRDAVAILKRLSILRIPPYELPADSFLEKAATEIITLVLAATPNHPEPGAGELKTEEPDERKLSTDELMDRSFAASADAERLRAESLRLSELAYELALERGEHVGDDGV